MDMRFYKIKHEAGGMVACSVVLATSEAEMARACGPFDYRDCPPTCLSDCDLAALILNDFLASSQFCRGPRCAMASSEQRVDDSTAALVVDLQQKFFADVIEPSATGDDGLVIIAGESVRRWLVRQGVDVKPLREETTAPCEGTLLLRRIDVVSRS
jgi:hypothetical protein